MLKASISAFPTPRSVYSATISRSAEADAGSAASIDALRCTVAQLSASVAALTARVSAIERQLPGEASVGVGSPVASRRASFLPPVPALSLGNLGLSAYTFPASPQPTPSAASREVLAAAHSILRRQPPAALPRPATPPAASSGDDADADPFHRPPGGAGTPSARLLRMASEATVPRRLSTLAMVDVGGARRPSVFA